MKSPAGLPTAMNFRVEGNTGTPLLVLLGPTIAVSDYSAFPESELPKSLDISGKGALGCALATAIFVLCGAGHAQAGETVLYAFEGGANGSYPTGGLVMDMTGNLYGTTIGNIEKCRTFSLNCGTVFKLAPDGTEKVLHHFHPHSGDGASPGGGLVMGGSGIFFGTTEAGGDYGAGTVFNVSRSGSEAIVHSFTGETGDGAEPVGGLITDSIGNLYGTTYSGGIRNCGIGCGTVFKIPSTGYVSILYNFQGGEDGASPSAGVIADGAGNLYGTTAYGGGTGCGGAGCGTVFKLAPDGTETVLYRFTGGSDGDAPYSGVIADSTGNLYGTTYRGGAGCGSVGCGTVFKVAPDGTKTELYSFCAGNTRHCSDGSNPVGSLFADSAGNFFGSTQLGGVVCVVARNHGCGVVFELTPDGTETVLHTFSGGEDGASPQGSFIANRSGNLYGVTEHGGVSERKKNQGTVFMISK